jgi:hypothetical protein
MMMVVVQLLLLLLLLLMMMVGDEVAKLLACPLTTSDNFSESNSCILEKLVVWCEHLCI